MSKTPREHSSGTEAAARSPVGVIFDLDGVLTDTAELHYQSWNDLADELAIDFDRHIGDEMRGLSRPESLAVFLRGHESRFSEPEKADIARRKNDAYLRRVDAMTPVDLLPGIGPLLSDLGSRGVRLAIASSSRNAGRVAEQLGIRPLFAALVDANTAPRSKPDPQVFLAAAQQLGLDPARCIVIEDAQAGVAAARAAGMQVVGVGPRERVGQAHLVVAGTRDLNADTVLALLGTAQR